MKWEENDNTFLESIFDGLETVWEIISPIIYFFLSLIALFMVIALLIILTASLLFVFVM